MPVALIGLGGALTGTASAGLALAAGTAAVGATAYTAAKAIKGKPSTSSSNIPAGQPGSMYRDPAVEGATGLAAQEKTAGQQYDDYAKYAPQYDAIDLQRMRTLMGAADGTSIFDLNKQVTDQANQQTTASNTALRQGDLNDLTNMGGQVRQASQNANPDLYKALNGLSTAADAGIAQTDAEKQYLAQAGQGYGQIQGQNVDPLFVTPLGLGRGAAIGQMQMNATQLGTAGPQAQAAMVNGNANTLAAQANNVSGNGIDPQGLTAQANVVNGNGVDAQGLTAQASMVRSPQASMLSRGQNMQALFGGATGIENTLQGQAQDGLNLGTSLAPEEIRAAQQAARVAATSRGLGNSNSALAQEVLNTYQAGQARLQQRQQFAGQANQLYRAGQDQDQRYGLNVQGQNLSQQAQGLQAQQSNQAAGLQAQGMNMSDQLARGQFNSSLNMQRQLANQSAGLQAQSMNMSDQLARGQYNSSLDMQGQLANQSAGLQAQGMNIQTGQANAGLNLQGQLANQSAGLQAQSMNMSDLLSRQSYNATNQQNTNNAVYQQGMAAMLANQGDDLSRDQSTAQLNLQGQLANQGNFMQMQQLNQANAFNTQQANNQWQAQGLSDLSQGNAMQQQRQAQAFAQQQAAAQGWLSTYQDPSMAILGRQSSNAGSNAGLMNIGNNITQPNTGAVRDMFNPYNSYNQDLNSSNQSAAYNLAIGNKNASAAKSSATMGAIGSLGSAALMAYFCWVAREVYGADNPRWLQFRHWMLTQAPAWFRNLYIRHGERFARYIADKPLLKRLIRAFMDSRINSMKQEASYHAA